MTIDIEFNSIILRKPEMADGAALNLLARLNPPLDMNSVYCNVLQCTHFADTCVVAEKEGELVGYVTGYLMPADPSIYFLWQVGVSPAARGCGLATRMIRAILSRDFCRGVRELNTTVTPSNQASRALFAGFAKKEGAEMTEEAHYYPSSVLDGDEEESLFRIRPLSSSH
jgi:L-2,4-diaminobutyric acid acetyltransferase